MGVGTIILVLLIGGLVLFSLGYIIWLRLKQMTKKKKK
jgi:TM2 domain-containing membrane protein YozV